MTKRVLSLLLVLVMVLSLSVPALAAEGEETDVAAVEQTETTPAADEPAAASEAVDEPAETAVVLKPDNANSLRDAITENADPFIQLTYYVSNDATVEVDKNVTIDLGGITVTDTLNVTSGTLTITDNTAPYFPNYGKGSVYISVAKGAAVTIQSGNVEIKSNAGTVNVAGGKVTNVVPAGAGTINVTAGELEGWTAAAGAVLNVSGGKVNNGLTINKDAKVNISGGEVNGAVILQSAKATLTMTGGTIKGYVDGTQGIVNISRGTVICADGRALRFNAAHRNNLSLSVSGGTFVGQTYAVWVSPTSATETHYITGGRFVPCIGGEKMEDTNDANNVPAEVDPSATVAHFRKTNDLDYQEYTLVGKTAVENAAATLKKAIITLLNGPATFTNVPDDTQITNWTDEDITVNGETVEAEGGVWGKWEAKIGDDKYNYLWNPDKPAQSALSQIRSGQTVTLLKDVLVEKAIEIQDKNVYFDLNGHILSLSDDLNIRNSNVPTVRTRKVVFSGEGDVKGTGSIHSGALQVFGGNVSVELVDTYFHAPIYCEQGMTGNKLIVRKDAFLSGWVGVTVPDESRFNGSVTVEGRIMGDLCVDAEGEFEVSLKSTAVIDKSVYVTGDEGYFTMVPGAVINGNLVLGEDGESTDHRMEIDISGGEVKGDCEFYLERHTNGLITDGVFGSNAAITSSFEMWQKMAGQDDGTYRGVAGGAFAHEVNNNPHKFLNKTTTPLAVVTGTTAHSGYWYVGNSIANALATVASKGSLELEHGELVLASVPNNDKFYVSVHSDPYGSCPNTTAPISPVLKVGYVSIGWTWEDIPGTAINTLNALIAKASNLYASGKIEEPDQAALIKAVEDGKALKHAWDEDYKDFDADTIDTKNNVQDAIDQLNTILAKYPNADEPEAPWYPADATGWQKNPNTGDIYYFIDGKMQKNLWVYSARKIWYYMNDEGIMETGVAYARAAYTYKVSTGEFSTKMEPAGWYYFETAADSDAPGRIRGGWHYTADYGWVWSIKEHKGFYGMITWADKYKGPIPTI